MSNGIVMVRRPRMLSETVVRRIIDTCETSRAVRISPQGRDLAKFRQALYQRFWRQHRGLVLRTRYTARGSLVCWAEVRGALRDG